MARTTLRQLLAESHSCVLAPCVYDCASARAVEMVGFKAAMLSGGEVSLALSGLIDYGFNDLSILEWVVSRVSETTTLTLAVDVDDGYGGPLAVYRMAKRLARVGAHALQLEDTGGLGENRRLIPREQFYAKIAAAVDALKGTDCILIARTDADPATELDEAVARCARAVELGAEMTTVVQLNNLEDARYVARRVPGWKMYPDVGAKDGVPEVTADDVYPLGFNYMTMHYTLKAAFDGMLEHGKKNFAQQGCLYTATKKDATGIFGESATPLYDPQGFMDLEARFTGRGNVYKIGSHEMPAFPEGFVKTPIEERL
jgi:methylisocitrate lyase